MPNSRGGRLLLVPSHVQSTLTEAVMETPLSPPIERNMSGIIICMALLLLKMTGRPGDTRRFALQQMLTF